jgi:hypothetical protein
MWCGNIGDIAGLSYIAAAVGIKEYFDHKEKANDTKYGDDKT